MKKSSNNINGNEIYYTEEIGHANNAPWEWIGIWLGIARIKELEYGEADANHHWKQDMSRVDLLLSIPTAIVYRLTVDDALANYRKAD